MDEGDVCDNCAEGHLYPARYVDGPKGVKGEPFLACCVCGVTYYADKLKPYLIPPKYSDGG